MEPKQVTYDICRHYLRDLEGVDPALARTVGGYHRSRNLAGLASCSLLFDVAKHTIKDWRMLRQVEAFFKKNALFVNPEVCSDAARKSFMDSERQCSDTNLRLRTLVGNTRLLDEPYRSLVHKMRHYICNVLGAFPVFLDELPHLVRVTPGATSTSSRRESLPPMKMRLRLYSTKRASKYLKALYHFYGFESLRTRPTSTNRVELVPKNWKTDRTIACEPEGNIPLQLAFDRYAKRRLRHFGIDLSNQSANVVLAKHASIHDDYVTVDFSAASDTISYNTVALVFPEEWFAYLDDVRTPMFRGVFGRGVYSKFSSMGNGSTFTIETLLFAAACYASCGNRDFLVYGDDVIIRKECFETFKLLTRFLGFTINEEKTFVNGSFRESCGGDFFDGVDVTPVYIRNVDKRNASLCHLVNTLMSLTFPGSNLGAYLLKLVKEYKLPKVPFNEGTMTGVWIDPAVARTRKLLVQRHGIDYYRAYVPKTKFRKFVDSRGYYLWFLMKNSQVFFAGPWGLANARATSTSSVPTFRHAYVRKWVRWQPPSTGMPSHLLWVTE